MLSSEEISELKHVMETAGRAIMDIYRKDKDIGVKLKNDNTPVTDADLLSNEIITEFLARRYPNIPVISEESDHLPFVTRQSFPAVWLLDPLDGTREFLGRSGEFTINLGLVSQGVAVAGFIYLPAFSRFYYAIKGLGAWEYTPSGARQLRAHRFSMADDGLRVVRSRTHTEEATLNHIEALRHPRIMHMGSALKFIAIADGLADYYPRMLHIMEWDTAAGQVLIEEAGGSLVDACTGSPLRYNKESLVNPHFIASGIQT